MRIHLHRLVVQISFGLAFFLASIDSTGASENGMPGKKTPRTDRYDDLLPPGAIARMGSVRFHHPGGIIAGAFSPGGKIILAVGSGNKGSALRFWETASGKELAGFEVTPTSLRGVAFSPNGKTVGLCCQSSVELFDMESGKHVRTFLSKNGDYPAAIISFAFSPDGKTLAAGCMESKDDNPIRVWEVDSGRELPPFAGRGESFNTVTFSADGKTLFCGPTTASTYSIGSKRLSAAICVWDVATRKKIREIDTTAWNHAFAPNGEIIAYESDGLHLVSVATGQSLGKIAGKHTFFGFAPDSKTLVSLDEDKSLTTWDVATAKAIRRFDGHLGNMSRLIGFSPDGKRLALMDDGWNKDGSVRFWDVSTGQEIRFFNGHQDDVSHVTYSPDGKLLASASKDRTVRLWDPATGQQLHVLKGHQGEVLAVAFAPDGKTLASSSVDGTTRLWDIGDGRLLVTFQNPPGRKAERFREFHAGSALFFAPDGKTLVAVGSDGMLAAWDWKAHKEVQRKVLDRDCNVRPVLLPSLGAVLTASGGEWDFRERAAESLYLWNLSRGQLIQEVSLRKGREIGYSISCTGIAASADEKMLVSSEVIVSQSLRGPVYDDPTLCFWERVTGKEILRIKNAMSSALAFSPDSRLLAVDDGGVRGFHGMVGSPLFGATISLWDTLTGEHHAKLSGHTAQVRCITFAPDGKTLASASADHTILVWNTPALKESKAGSRPTAEQLQLWWEDLAATDPARAHQAGAKLVFSAAPAVALIRDKVRPAMAVDPKIIAPLIKNLESSQFQVRDQAIRQLEQMEDLAEPALQAALTAPPSLEMRRRLESLLEKTAIHSSRQIQNLRALTILERIASTEARQVIESLSKGTLDARITREAQASLRRMSAQTSFKQK